VTSYSKFLYYCTALKKRLCHETIYFKKTNANVFVRKLQIASSNIGRMAPNGFRTVTLTEFQVCSTGLLSSKYTFAAKLSIVV